MSRKDPTRPSTLRDVAALAQVSVSTASRALSGGHYVAAEVLERVRAAALDVSYQPNEAARGLRTTRTLTIGMLCTHLRVLALLDFMDRFSAQAEAAGYSVFVANARSNPDQYRTLLRRMFERRVDGLIVTNPAGVTEELRPYVESHRPVIAVFSRGADCSEIPLVTTSERKALFDAMARARELGHSSVAYFDSALAKQSFRPSYVTEAAAASGLACQMIEAAHDSTAEWMAERLRRIVKGPLPVTAIAVSHSLLPSLIQATRSMGLRIPLDLSVFSFSDSTIVDSLLDPPVAAVHNDTGAMGARAAQLLVEWIINGTEPPNVVDVDVSTWADSGSMGPAPDVRAHS